MTGIHVPASWEKLRSRQQEIWNPKSPDNMLVRHLALKAGVDGALDGFKGGLSAFEREQRRIAKLARKRKRMGRIPPPTPEEWAAFTKLCIAAGMVVMP